MLDQIIQSLKKQGQWEFFVTFFSERQDELIGELRSGVETLERLNEINNQLELYEKLKDLGTWAARVKPK